VRCVVKAGFVLLLSDNVLLKYNGSLAKKATFEKGLDQHIRIQHTFLILNIVVWFLGKFFAVED
jgi:hypothetical protein